VASATGSRVNVLNHTPGQHAAARPIVSAVRPATNVPIHATRRARVLWCAPTLVPIRIPASPGPVAGRRRDAIVADKARGDGKCDVCTCAHEA